MGRGGSERWHTIDRHARRLRHFFRNQLLLSPKTLLPPSAMGMLLHCVCAPCIFGHTHQIITPLKPPPLSSGGYFVQSPPTRDNPPTPLGNRAKLRVGCVARKGMHKARA